MPETRVAPDLLRTRSGPAPESFRASSAARRGTGIAPSQNAFRSTLGVEKATAPAGNRGLTATTRGVMMAVSKRTRFEVLRRDNYTCRYCRSTDNPITVDHVIPTALGGSDAPDNLVAACKDCNAGKSSSSPDAAQVAQVSEDALRWSRAIRAAADQIEQERHKQFAYSDAFAAEWKHRWAPNDWENTLGQLYIAGLPINEMLDAVRVAQSAYGVDDRFRYFCGVAWTKIRKIQQIAQQIFTAEQEQNGEEPWPTVDIHHLLCHVVEGTHDSEAGYHELLSASVLDGYLNVRDRAA